MLKKQHGHMETNWENKAFGENSAREVQSTRGGGGGAGQVALAQENDKKVIGKMGRKACGRW